MGGHGQKIKFERGEPKFKGDLQHFTSRKLAEANLFLLNIKKNCSFVSDTKFQKVNQMFSYLILLELYDYVIMKYEEKRKFFYIA